MSWRIFGVVGFAVLTGASSAAAQAPGKVELGGFLRWTVFDNSLRIDDFFATGGRAGVSVFKSFQVEGDIARVSTNGPPGVAVSYVPIHARLIYQIPLRQRSALLLGAGYVHNEYGQSRDGSDDGYGALVGVRLPISRNLAVRFDATADYMPSPVNAGPAVDHNWNLGLHQGLSLFFGGTKKPKEAPVPEMDSDQDGVPDSLDRCADTALGTRVDAAGCPLDSDGDGVLDSADRCPDTPMGAQVDAAGCPPDSDADGVADSADRCPDTPRYRQVDASGCPPDSDGDGVSDASDRCPNTPASTQVDATGCPADSDGDGVVDAADRCPDTPVGTKVDSSGCLLLFEENRKSLVLEGVHFANGKAELTPESHSILENVAASLIEHSEVRVIVEGHTSSTGGRQLNLRLSQARAQAVRDFLVLRGVAEDRLVARGFGPDRPIASNTTLEGQAKNRRVELRKLE